MKVSIKTELLVDQDKTVYEVLGIYTNHCLKFQENDVKVILDLKKHCLIRCDSSKKLVYNFIENEETLNDVFVFSTHMLLQIPIYTKHFEVSDCSCVICWRLVLEDEEVCYQICWEEVK